MQKISCPACGGEIQFTSKLAVSLTCRYCDSLIVRDSDDIRAMGKVAALLDDTSPLQLFTTGKAREGRFRIIGRCQWQWSEGFWNEWFIELEGSPKGAWLAEAQGQYVLCKEDPRIKSPPPISAYKIDEDVTIGAYEFSVDDIKRAKLASFEGELPFSPKVGDTKTIVDLSYDEIYGCVEFSADGPMFTIGSVYEFDELSFRDLKPRGSWT